jgi:predicted Zn-dependent protease
MRLVLPALLCASLVHAAPPSPAPKKQAAEQAARGDAWTLAGRCDEAVKAYRASLAIDAKNATVKVRLAHCLARSGGAEEAAKILDSLVDSPPPIGPMALLERGDLALGAGDAKAAAAAYQKLVDKQPDNTDAKLALLDALAQLAKNGDAEARTRATTLAQKIENDPRADATAQRRAQELDGFLKYGDAGKDLIEGKRLLASGDAKSAVALLERAATAHPDLEEAQYLLGLAYIAPEVNRRADAIKAWKKAAHVKEAWFKLGMDAYEGGDLDGAIDKLNGALKLDEKYQAAQYQLGLVLHEKGNSAAAQQAWQKAVMIDPRSELGRWASTKLAMVTGNVNALAEGQVIDPGSEIGIGIKLAEQVESQFGRIDDPKLEERLTKILHRLTAVSDRPEREMRYRIILVEVPMINALTLPGGSILVFRGLVDLVKRDMSDSDDAWASILGHECAHAALRHGMGMVQMASSLAQSGKAFNSAGDLASLMNTVSRAHEFEADQFGALYTYRAGFQPAFGITLHEKMVKAMGEIPRGMTHPTHAERMDRIRDYLLDLRAKVHGFDVAVKELGTGDYDAAAQRFEVFLGVYPDSTAARSNLGAALHRKALAVLTPATRFRRSTDVDPNSRARKVELHAGEANVGGLKPPQVDARLLREAAGEYEAALAIDPGYVHALVNLGAALDDLKDKRRSREVLERAVRTAPQSKEAWNNLGAVAAESGDTARGLEALKKALELDGNYADAQFNLAMTQEQAGKDKDAAQAWDKYLALDGKSGWADVARTHRARFK